MHPILARRALVLIPLLLLTTTLTGCSFFVPAYDNPDSKQFEKQKEKARDQVKKDTHTLDTTNSTTPR